MTTSLTSRLKLVKPDPGTGELVNVATQVNSNMDKLDSSAGATPCTELTRPSAPYDGQLIRETDTRRVYIWNVTQNSWDQFVTVGGVYLAQIDVERATSVDHSFRTKVIGNTQPRLIVQADGRLSWGSGTAAADVHLYRSSANMLRTDHVFDPVGGINNEAKITPSLLNGWTGYDNIAGFQGPKYWKDKNGIVHIDGALEGGTITAGTVIFNLPVGYRPAAHLIFPCWGNGSMARIDVESGGAVKTGAGFSASLTCISGVNFKAEQ